MLNIKIIKHLIISVLKFDQISIVDWEIMCKVIARFLKKIYGFLEISWLRPFSFFKLVSRIRLLNQLRRAQGPNFVFHSLRFWIYIKVAHV